MTFLPLLLSVILGISSTTSVCRSDEPEKPDIQRARDLAQYETLFDLVTSRSVPADLIRQLNRVCASRPDVRRLSQEVIDRAATGVVGDVSLRKVQFAANILGSSGTDPAINALLRLMNSDKADEMHRRLALVQINALFKSPFGTYEDDFKDPFEDQVRSTMSLVQATSLAEVRGRIVRESQVVLKEACAGYRRQFMMDESDRDRHEIVESLFNKFQFGIDFIAHNADARTATEAFVQALRELKDIPFDAEDSDIRVKLTYFTLTRVQHQIGPIAGVGEWHLDPPGIEAAAESIVLWWNDNKDASPIEWRMRRLALHGYETRTTDGAAFIQLALLRAARQGTDAELQAATQVLDELNICPGIVPAVNQPEVSTHGERRVGAAVVDAVLRSQVCECIGLAWNAGMTVVWDNDAKAWRAKKKLPEG